jgi:hemerythrin-like domain-containing protein
MNDEVSSAMDTRDMIWVHNAFRRAFTEAPGQIASVDDGDVERAQYLTGYLAEVLWFLHAHHDGEDQLLYPLLVERAPETGALFSRMETQHQAVAASIGGAEEAAERFGRSASTDDGDALAAACSSLIDQASDHLVEEETEVLPVVSRTITPEEWGALPGHVLSQYRGTRVWLLLGLVIEAVPDDLRATMIGRLPPPVVEMWTGFGSDAFNNEMRSIRTVTA